MASSNLNKNNYITITLKRYNKKKTKWLYVNILKTILYSKNKNNKKNCWIPSSNKTKKQPHFQYLKNKF